MRTYRCLIGYTDVEEVATDKTTFWQNGGHLVSLSGLTVPNTPCMAGLQREGFCKSEMGGLDELMKRGCHLHARHEGSRQDPYSARS